MKLSGKSVLVTGGIGFVGNRLAEMLLRKKARVTISVHVNKTSSRKKGKKARFIEADLSKKLDSRLFEGFEVVFHFASFVPKRRGRGSDSSKKAFLHNVLATKNLLQALERNKNCKQLVFASTGEVYGIPRNVPLSEEAIPKPLSNYAKSKLVAEKLVLQFGRRYGLPVSVLRFTTLYGPEDYSTKAIPSFTRAAVQGKPLFVSGSGNQKRDYLFVDDAARAAILACEKRANGIFNIGSSRPITIRELANLILNFSKSKSLVLHTEHRKRELDLYLDSRKAEKEIGFAPQTTLENGLKKVLAWTRTRKTLMPARHYSH